LRPDEIEALKAGKRVTRTLPDRLPHGPPSLLPEDFEAMKAGKHVIKMGTSVPPPFLEVGTVLPIISSERPHHPPPLLPEELEALRAGKTVTKTAEGRPPLDTPPDLRVKVVEYRQEGPDHIYVFEAL